MQELCPRCAEPMRAATVKTAIWMEDRVVLVEDIPAGFCDSCVEQFYDEETTDVLRRLAENRFASLEPTRQMTVNVYSLPQRTEPTE